MPLCNTDRIIKDEDVITEYFTASQIICSCSGFLLSAIFNVIASKTAQGILYDGQDDTGKKLFYHRPYSPLSKVFILSKPICFHKGLYLYIVAMSGATIQYVPDY